MPGKQRAILLILAAIAAVAAIIIVPSLGDNGKSDAEKLGGATTATPGQPQPPKRSAVPVITVRNGKPVGGVQRLEFNKGDTVKFTVKSDVADEIHVHGYDLKKNVPAGGQATMSFKADADGIYEAELEKRGVQIAELRINP